MILSHYNVLMVCGLCLCLMNKNIGHVLLCIKKRKVKSTEVPSGRVQWTESNARINREFGRKDKEYGQHFKCQR